jgi:hypothetical protein
MDKNGKSKLLKQVQRANTLEALKDIGTSTANQMKEEAAKIPEDFMEQLFGIKTPNKKYSGEIEAGEAIELNEVLSGKREEFVIARKQQRLERQLLEQERIQTERKSTELRIQLKTIQEQILILAESTEELAQETQIAAMQVTVEPGVYHVIFFEKLLEFIKSFRKKIDEAGVWLHSANSRASKKNAWGNNYKKSGGKYLLSSEHYLQRSAG